MSPPLCSLLSSHLDEDTVEYISSLLEDDPADEDAREAVEALITGALDDETTAETLIRELWRLLSSTLSGGGGAVDASNGKGSRHSGDAATAATNSSSSVMEETTKRLDKAVTMKENYVVSYANGLRAKEEHGPNDEGKESAIQNFYANMIGIQSDEVMSERARRKAAQKALREKKADEDRLQAIQDAMAMAEEDPVDMAERSDNNNGGGGGGGGGAEYEAGDSHVDVHFRDFNLPNKKGSGTDLLANVNLTLSKGRRYGLMGRNGCGKVSI
jgi:ABC-type multidrug transport system fused ATPase/permease subunit